MQFFHHYNHRNHLLMLLAHMRLFYYFYHDFGYIGVMIGSLMFGCACGIIESEYEQNPTKKNKFIFLYAFYVIVSSMVRWGLVHPTTGMIVYYIPFFFNNVKIKFTIKR